MYLHVSSIEGGVAAVPVNFSKEGVATMHVSPSEASVFVLS